MHVSKGSPGTGRESIGSPFRHHVVLLLAVLDARFVVKRALRFWCALLLVLGLLAIPAGGGHDALAQTPSAAGSSCSVSGPDTGAYVVRLCIATPSDSDTVSGNVQVAATVTTQSGAAPSIQFATFYFSAVSTSGTRSILRDWEEPYEFTLPTDRWADRDSLLEVDVRFRDAFVAERAAVVITTANDVRTPPGNTGRWQPFSIEGDDPVVLAAVGDGAGGMQTSWEVAGLIESWDPDMFAYLGDVYNNGTYTEFMNYYEPTFGRLRDITNPVPGNHEGGSQFQGYREYWNSSLQYYEAVAGGWRILFLDSTERSAQTSPGTPQFEWLRQKLEEEEADCTMVVYHEPRWALIEADLYTYLDDVWALLAEEDVDLVLNGHEHKYERWSPLDANGDPDPEGPVEIVAGTGGHELLASNRTDPRVAVTYNGAGAFRIELSPGGANYEFINTEGAVIDSGSLACGDEPESDEEEGEHEDVAGTAGNATIVNTGGVGARCRTGPDLAAEVITVLPEGTTVPLRGEPVGEWQPIECAGQLGYVYRSLIAIDQAAVAPQHLNGRRPRVAATLSTLRKRGS